VIYTEQCDASVKLHCIFPNDSSGMIILLKNELAFRKLLSLVPGPIQCALVKWSFFDNTEKGPRLFLSIGDSSLVNHGVPNSIYYSKCKKNSKSNGNNENKLLKNKYETSNKDNNNDEKETVAPYNCNDYTGKASFDLPAGSEILEDYCKEYKDVLEPSWYLRMKGYMGIDGSSSIESPCVRV
jgi:hypothetical protein